MNRTRINQLLGVLLFPYLDPVLQKNDYFRKRYEAYKEYIEISKDYIAEREKKQIKDDNYQKETIALTEYLASRSKAGVKSYDDLLMFCDSYYPFEVIERKEEKAQNEETDCIVELYFDTLIKIGNSLLTYRDGVAAIRTWNIDTECIDTEDIFYVGHVFDKVQIWNMLCCYMVPDTLIAAFMVECDLDVKALYGQKPYISLSDKLFAKSLTKGVAENHLHFNAGFDYETIWLNTMDLSKLAYYYRKQDNITEEKRAKLWAAAIFRILAAQFFVGIEKQKKIGKKFIPWLEEREESEALIVLQGLYTGELKSNIAEYALNWKWLESIFIKQGIEGDIDYLLAMIYKDYIELKTSSEFILLYHCFAYRKSCKEDECFSRIFLQYIRIKNEIFQNIQQSNLIPGLRHFQKYFDAAKQAETDMVGKNGLVIDVFRVQARQTCLKKLEIRIAPSIDMNRISGTDEPSERGFIQEVLCKQLYDLFFIYRRYILECVLGVRETKVQMWREEQERASMKFSYYHATQVICEKNKERIKEFQVPTLGIVYHLLKEERLEHISGYSCAKAIKRTGGFNLGHRLFTREVMSRITEVVEDIRARIPFLNEYVVGLDAASDENAMEPWMFAPAYNRMRSKKRTKPVIKMGTGKNLKYSTIQNMGFTYHVGEDFRHIASGLRHVDEVIERLHYKPGDRLGHAIVLGIDIEKWVQDNEVVALPLGEYLDNLLWIWGKNVYDGVELPIQLERLEKEILEKGKRIYGNQDGEITVMMLYEAYKKKFLSNHKDIIIKLNEKGQKDKNPWENKEGYCFYNIEKSCEICVKEFQLWNDEKLLYTNYCPVFEEKRNRVLRLFIKDSEIAVYKVLQEYLLKKVEQIGIYVETNPTSNVTIGDFDDLREHPIFKMNSLELNGHHVMVTVNSDDPAVFNTNVENELAYIYYAMEHKGYAKEDILFWIDKIRQNGMEASFIQKVKDVPILLKEVSSILDVLKRYK